MNFYHFHAEVISRGSGRSAVAAAAYRSGTVLTNEYDGVMHDYTKKKNVVYSEILLPKNAPAEWQDRETLWNAVEETEKTKDSRLAREIRMALPKELSLDTWVSMIREFLREHCVDQGMCADFSIHNDGDNPHVHIMLTARPLDEYGKWMPKTQKEYVCFRDEGMKFANLTAEEFKDAKDNGWEKMYKFRVNGREEWLPPSYIEKYYPDAERLSKHPQSTKYGRQNPIIKEWNRPEKVQEWRKAWETVINCEQERIGLSDRVDCRSYRDQGLDLQPMIHEGYASRKLEKQGIVTEVGAFNRQIREDNHRLLTLKENVTRLVAEISKDVLGFGQYLAVLRRNLHAHGYEDADFSPEVATNRNQAARARYRELLRELDRCKQESNEIRAWFGRIHFSNDRKKHDELAEQLRMDLLREEELREQLEAMKPEIELDNYRTLLELLPRQVRGMVQRVIEALGREETNRDQSERIMRKQGVPSQRSNDDVER